MRTEIKKLDKLKRTVNVDVEGEEFLKEKKEVYEQNSKHLKVPGFRLGNAPIEVLDKHHGKLLKEELVKRLVPLFYRRALDENKISPASLPHIYNVECTSSRISFSADLEVKPQVDIKENIYKGIKIKDKKVEVKEEEIDKVLTNLKESIKKITDRELDDNDLAKWSAYPDIAGLREAVKGQLYVEKLSERKQKIYGQIRSQLVKALNIDLPKSEVDRHHSELVNRETYGLQQRGVSKEDLDKYKKDLEEKLRPLAEEDVKLFYALEAIANQEKIKIDNNNFGDTVLGFVLSQCQY